MQIQYFAKVIHCISKEEKDDLIYHQDGLAIHKITHFEGSSDYIIDELPFTEMVYLEGIITSSEYDEEIDNNFRRLIQTLPEKDRQFVFQDRFERKVYISKNEH